jgi:hypothetical protein
VLSIRRWILKGWIDGAALAAPLIPTNARGSLRASRSFASGLPPSLPACPRHLRLAPAASGLPPSLPACSRRLRLTPSLRPALVASGLSFAGINADHKGICWNQCRNTRACGKGSIRGSILKVWSALGVISSVERVAE